MIMDFTHWHLMKLIPKALQVYGSTSWIFDDFKRKPWEVLEELTGIPQEQEA
jgi:cytochrome bd-type quinol oxidase subunit 1